MSLWQLVLRSLRQHALSTLAAIVSLALGVGMMTAVVSLRNETHRQFTRVGLGVDGVLGPKGSALQIVLNAIYHLEEMPGKVPWNLVAELRKHPVVERVIPFCTGHSYAGVRVNAVESSFFQGFEIQPGRTLDFDPARGGSGRMFASGTVDEAVIGWEAARRLGVKLGDGFNPVCGITTNDPVHQNDRIVFVGILARTGTPYDRAIYIPLERFYTLGGHGNDAARMLTDLDYREVSGAFVRVRRIRGDLMHPGVRDLAFQLKQNPLAQLVIPNEVLPSLFNIIGWVDHVLLGIAVLVVGLASLFLFVALLNALRERRRDYALLRCLGASRRWVFGLVFGESTLIAALGGIHGLLLGQALMFVGADLIQRETGVLLEQGGSPTLLFGIWAGVTILGALTGLFPAIRAYRLSVVEDLRPFAS